MKDAFTEKLLSVRHTRCRYGKPLCVLDNLPGELCYATPVQLRELAKALEQAATDGERRRSKFDETRRYLIQA